MALEGFMGTFDNIDNAVFTSLLFAEHEAPRVSFEFTPPTTEKMEQTLWRSIRRLEPLQPSFVSVTYGAGGSTRERTHDTVRRIVTDTDLAPAAHLTCVGATCAEIDQIVQAYWDAGVRHIVALRGDPPGGEEAYTPHPGGYANAADLVAGILRIADFDVSVAVHPEGHPDAGSDAAELENFRAKIDAGASRAITQFFFDPDMFLRFIDKVLAAGISVPIIPGIMPVSNFAAAKRMAGKAGAEVPKWLGELFAGLDDDPTTRRLIAATVAIEQSRYLQARGIEDFHFYTLNRADLSYAICHALGLRPQH